RARRKLDAALKARTPWRRCGSRRRWPIWPSATRSIRIKQGTWGLIHVLEDDWSIKLSNQGVRRQMRCSPRLRRLRDRAAVLHEVAPLGPVRFYVEFYRLGEAG